MTAPSSFEDSLFYLAPGAFVVTADTFRPLAYHQDHGIRCHYCFLDIRSSRDVASGNLLGKVAGRCPTAQFSRGGCIRQCSSDGPSTCTGCNNTIRQIWPGYQTIKSECYVIRPNAELRHLVLFPLFFLQEAYDVLSNAQALFRRGKDFSNRLLDFTAPYSSRQPKGGNHRRKCHNGGSRRRERAHSGPINLAVPKKRCLCCHALSHNEWRRC